jgi:hypothetical protein
MKLEEKVLLAFKTDLVTQELKVSFGAYKGTGRL